MGRGTSKAGGGSARSGGAARHAAGAAVSIANARVGEKVTYSSDDAIDRFSLSGTITDVAANHITVTTSDGTRNWIDSDTIRRVKYR